MLRGVVACNFPLPLSFVGSNEAKLGSSIISASQTASSFNPWVCTASVLWALNIFRRCSNVTRGFPRNLDRVIVRVVPRARILENLTNWDCTRRLFRVTLTCLELAFSSALARAHTHAKQKQLRNCAMPRCSTRRDYNGMHLTGNREARFHPCV